jgi:biotin carboxyl carrier protein
MSPAATKKALLREQLMLWPGESSTFENVTVTWEVTAQDQATTGWFGKLKFQGPKSALAGVNPPIKRVLGPPRRTEVSPEGTERVIAAPRRTELAREGTVSVYLDGVLFTIHGQVAGPSATLICEASQEPSERKYDTARHSDRVPISSLSPIALNQWQLTFSDQPKKYPDGDSYFEITAVDTATSTKMTVPATRVAFRRFGRFDVRVMEICEPTRTAVLSVDAQPDFTIRGGDTYVASSSDLSPRDSETYSGYFERLGKQYGFDVKWVEDASHPETADYLKQTKEMPVVFGGRLAASEGGIIREILGEKTSHYNFLLKWTDPSHLEVSPDYTGWIAAKDAERRQAYEKKNWEERFQTEYQLVTRVFQMRYASAATIKDLIQPLLYTYYLVCDYQPRSGTEYNYRIDKTMPDSRQGLTRVLSTSAERCTADDRTNSLLVMAIPITLDKIALAIKEWDVARGVQGPSGRYRIEVVLLQGGKAGEKVEDVSRATKLSFPIAGMVKDLPARPGMKVRANENLARLDPTDQELRVQQAEIELMQASSGLKVVNESSKRTEELVKTGLTSQDEALKAQVALTAAQGKVDAAKLALIAARTQLDRCDLRAPTTGTVATVQINLNERVEPGQVIVTFIPEVKSPAKTEATSSTALRADKVVVNLEDKRLQAQGGVILTVRQDKTDTFTPELARQYGISQEDLKLFGFDGLALLGKGLVTLSAERSDTGRALVSLTEAYRCEVEFQDVRQPYVIVKGRLLGAQSDKPLMENTLFLEKDKPSLLGLTNLRQALILVLRLYDTPSGSPTAPAPVTPATAP